MSDVIAPVAPVAPTQTATEGTAAPAPAPTVTEAAVPAPRTAADFLARIKSKANGFSEVTSPAPTPTATTETATPVVDATGRVHGPDGKFVPKPAGDEPAASDVSAAPTAVEAVIAERVRIALEEGHPLRERGLAELPFDVPKEHEEIARWLANQPVKKREIAQTQEEARQARAGEAEARAEASFWRENAGSVFTPEFYAKYTDIKQTYGDADAERYKRAVLAEAQGQLDQQVGSVRAVQQVQQTANAFRAAAMQDAQQRFPGWVTTNGRGEVVPTPEMEVAFRSYGAFISGTGASQPTAQDWYSIATPLYERSGVGQQRRADEARRITEQATAKAQQDAAERERQALEAAANQRKANPLQGVPNIQTGLAVPGGNTGPKTAREFLELTKQRARGLA